MRLIREFMDKPVIKIITGMRRSGKSALLELTRQELLDRGVDRKRDDGFGQIFITDCKPTRLRTILDKTGDDYSLFTVENGGIVR